MKRILAVKWRQLGDTILWTAALDALKRWEPDSVVDIAMPAAYRALFEADGRFDGKWPLFEDVPSLHAVTREVKTRRYDFVLNFHASAKSRAFCQAVGGAAVRLIHHHDRAGRNFGSDKPILNLGKPASAIERDLNVVRTLGWAGDSPAPSLKTPESWKQAAALRWGPKGTRPRLVMSPSASRPSKRWPLENFASLAERLSQRWDIAVIFESERLFDDKVWQKGRLAASARLFETPALSDAAGLLSLADGFVGGDSGIKHMAAALGVRTVTLFGPESVGEWHGYDPARHIALQNEMACRDQNPEDRLFAWCGVETCPLSSHACVTLHRPEQVEAALEKNRTTFI